MHCKSKNVLVQSRFSLLIISSVVAFLAGLNQPLKAQTPNGNLSVPQVKGGWERYTLKEKRLSVLLPTVPAMSSYTHTYWPPFSKRRLRNLIGAYSHGTAYVIEIYDVKQSLDEFLAESRPSNYKREVTVSGIRGKEYTHEDDVIKTVTQYFVVSSLLYRFGAHSSRLGNPDVDIPKFLESINFDEANAGRPILNGPGVQPLLDSTTVTDGGAARIFTGKEVTNKARVVMKPEPAYTEDARRNEITGTVVLRAVFSSGGDVTNIRVVSGLPHGLTENAIYAARQLRFIPAIKDGHFVSMYIQLEYNFNLY
jgi:TonB family protein